VSVTPPQRHLLCQETFFKRNQQLQHTALAAAQASMVETSPFTSDNPSANQHQPLFRPNRCLGHQLWENRPPMTAYRWDSTSQLNHKLMLLLVSVCPKQALPCHLHQRPTQLHFLSYLLHRKKKDLQPSTYFIQQDNLHLVCPYQIPVLVQLHQILPLEQRNQVLSSIHQHLAQLQVQ